MLLAGAFTLVRSRLLFLSFVISYHSVEQGKLACRTRRRAARRCFELTGRSRPYTARRPSTRLAAHARGSAAVKPKPKDAGAGVLEL